MIDNKAYRITYATEFARLRALGHSEAFSHIAAFRAAFRYVVAE